MINYSRTEKKSFHRVCEVVRHARIAGTEKHVFLLAPKLNKEVFDVTVCSFEQGELVDRFKEREITTFVIDDNRPAIHFLKLIAFLRRSKFDIVHCHSGGYACLAAKIAGIKRIVYTKHGIGFTKEELRRRTLVRKFRDLLVDKCVCVYIALTKHDKMIMTEVLHVDQHKIRIIYNGIDSSFREIKTARNRNSPTIGTVARLTKQKGLSFLIKAIPEILKYFGDLKVLIAGNGKEEGPLKELSKTLGISENVEFLGYVENVAEVINNMDVFILPSVWEGFPYVLLEAMALGKPIVASNIFGVNEIIDDNTSGMLVKPEDSDDIAKAVIELLSNHEKARRISEFAYRKVSDSFSLNQTVSQIEDLYLALIKNA